MHAKERSLRQRAGLPWSGLIHFWFVHGTVRVVPVLSVRTVPLANGGYQDHGRGGVEFKGGSRHD